MKKEPSFATSTRSPPRRIPLVGSRRTGGAPGSSRMSAASAIASVARIRLKIDFEAPSTRRSRVSRLRSERAAHEAAGGPFNLGSPKQIQAILFDQLELPVLAKTPKGQPSTAESVLQELALDYALPRLILEHRAFSKLKSTYTDALPACINPATGRVHTSYHQAVASKGGALIHAFLDADVAIRRTEGFAFAQITGQ